MGHENILEAIGSTPLVKIDKLNPNHQVEIWAKLEGCNPGGSVKDRITLRMVEEAERSGRLTRKKIVLEPTSGNTGIGLAMVAAVKGYKLEAVMPESVSLERRKLLRAFGARLILTPAAEGTDGAIIRARRMAEKSPGKYFMPDQFSNPSNYLAHYHTTGPEIIEQVKGKIDAFVVGIGTTGTMMGSGRRLKESDPGIRVVAAEPKKGHRIQGLKNMKEAIVPGIYDPGFPDEIIRVKDPDAYRTARKLARVEGIFAGMSSGAALWAAAKKAREMERGRIVTIFPDRGEKYLSTGLFG